MIKLLGRKRSLPDTYPTNQEYDETKKHHALHFHHQNSIFSLHLEFLFPWIFHGHQLIDLEQNVLQKFEFQQEEQHQV